MAMAERSGELRATREHRAFELRSAVSALGLPRGGAQEQEAVDAVETCSAGQMERAASVFALCGLVDFL